MQALDPPNDDALPPHLLRQGLIPKQHLGTIPDDSDEEMKAIMKSTVDCLYRLLWQRQSDSSAYKEAIAFGCRHTLHWDDPKLPTPRRDRLVPK